jgi:hypothetical protein
MVSLFPKDTTEDYNKRELQASLYFENNGTLYLSQISKTVKGSQKTTLSIFDGKKYNPTFTQQEAQKELNKIV